MVPCAAGLRLTHWRRSQGGVKFPTGGMWAKPHEPASGPGHSDLGVSRSGERPEPTVTVRMEESDLAVRPLQGGGGAVMIVPDERVWTCRKRRGS